MRTPASNTLRVVYGTGLRHRHRLGETGFSIGPTAFRKSGNPKGMLLRLFVRSLRNRRDDPGTSTARINPEARSFLPVFFYDHKAQGFIPLDECLCAKRTKNRHSS